jgi:TatD DNase family protein
MRVEIADSHAHLDMKEFDADREDVLRHAQDRGVKAILCPAELTEPASLPRILELREKFAWLAAAAGVHPHNAGAFSVGHLDRIRELDRNGEIAAIGEIGLDFHYNFSPAERQREVFRSQLRLAQEIGRPVIIHSRNSGREVIAAIEEEHFARAGVLHCFTEDWETARSIMDLGFFISFSGILTYASAGSLREIAKKIPLDRLLVETDSPYLVPAPWKGRIQRNEPAFVVETARRLAELKSLSLESLALRTLQNFHSLF